MTDIQDRAGAKWFAGLVLAVLLVNMGNGLVLTAYAEEGGDPPAPPVESTLSQEEHSGPTAPPGEDGEPGPDGDEPVSDGAPSDITTGDAEAGATAGGIVNVTDIDTNASSTPATSTPPASAPASIPPAATTTATSTSPTQVDTSAASSTPEPTSTPENSGSGSGNIEITQELAATTTLAAEGNTGENTITDPDGGTQDTGNGNVWGQDNFFFNIALVDSSLQIEVLLNPTESELDFRNQLIDFFSFSAESGEAEECVRFYNCKKDNLNATTTNSALLERNMAVLCNSGANYGGLISTGNCSTSGVMTTMGNWFAFNSNLMVLLVNQIGDMNADVVLPEPSFFENMRKGTIGNGSTLEIDNNASTTVDGASLANSGATYGEEGVKTGNADADAATITMINQLNPLTCFIIAVGGTWNGEVYQLPQGFMSEETPFGSVICGRGSGVGDVKAINAVVKNDLQMVVNALSASNTGGNAGQFVTTGNAKSFLTILNVVNTVFINQDWMLGLFTVSGDWNGDLTFGARPDASPAEQAASDIISGKKSGVRHNPPNSKAVLTKTSSVAVATAPSTVEYTITLKNNGDKIYRAMLEDTLTNPAGAVVNTQKWDLGTVLAGEEIVVEYSVEFKGNLLPGNYVNTAKLTGRLGSANGTAIKPVSTLTKLELLGGEVLGVEDCPAYLTHYISPLGGNDPGQVRLLETFLRDGRGEDINPDGTYDGASVEAIKRFQAEHADEILSPWGIGEPTGHVFYTTRKKINELYCQGEKEFPLSSLEAQRILMYRNGLLQPSAPTGVIPSANPWSAMHFPLFSELNLFPPLAMPNIATSPATTPGLFSRSPSLNSYPLLTLLRDIFSQLALSFSVERAQASH